MMKQILLSLIIVIILVSCKSKQGDAKPLFEIIYQSEYGGAPFRFYELVTEQKEFKMFLNDKNLKSKIKPTDILYANFLLLNMGEKSTGGYSFSVSNIEEKADKIVIKVVENSPKSGENVTFAMTNPMCIIRINSKKAIEFIE